MSRRQFFSRVLFCIIVLLGSMAPSLGMEPIPKGKEEASGNAPQNQAEGGLGGRLKFFWDTIKEKAHSSNQSSYSGPTPSINIQRIVEASGKATSIFDDHKKLQKGKEEATEEVPSNINNDNNTYSHSQPATLRPQRVYAEQQSFQQENPVKKYPFGILNAGYDERLFRESLSNAPMDIQDIIDDLLDPSENNEETREIALLGPTGSGKSTLAKAIVALGLNHEYLFVPATSLLNHFKHKTCENIYLLFESLREHEPRPHLILDEVNVLGDSHLQDQSDGADIANTLWTCMDMYNKENGSLLIATTNNLKRMPTQIQQRFNGNIIQIPYRPIAIKDLRFAMVKHLKYSLAEECEDNEFLEALIRQTQILSTAEVNKMIKSAVRMARKNKITLNNKTIVTAKDINSACAKILYSREHFCDFSEQLAAEERRHRETLAQNRELANRSHDLSIDQHTSTQHQNAEHHADSQALSTRQFAATQLQTDDHFIASQGLSREQHDSSQQLTAAIHDESQQLSVNLHNNAQQQTTDLHNNSQQLTVALHNSTQQLTVDLHNNAQDQNALQHGATLALQEEHFVQGVRVQAHMSINNFGASVGGGIGGAGANGSVSVGNIGKKDHLYAYAFTPQQLAINDELNQHSDRRVTTLLGEVKRAAPVAKATVEQVGAMLFGLH